MKYYLYKGLKRPLVFMGLKEKYIYYAVGVALGGMISIAILSSTFGTIGLLIGIAMTAAAIWWIYRTQDKKGLYNKTKNHNELHVFPPRIRTKKRK